VEEVYPSIPTEMMEKEVLRVVGKLKPKFIDAENPTCSSLIMVSRVPLGV